MGAGWSLFGGGRAIRIVEASTLHFQDSDGDGLPDRQEAVLRTDPHLADSDFDGYDDGLEFALQSDPTLYSEIPQTQQLSVAMSARGEGGKLLVFTAVYAGDGVFDDKIVRFGAVVGDQIVNLPLKRLSPYMNTETHTLAGGAALMTIDLNLPESFISQTGAATVFAAVGITGAKRYASWDKVDLSTVQGVMMLRMPAPRGPGGASTIPVGAMINVPIPTDGDISIPLDWTPSKVCFQISEIVGTQGSVVIHQIIYAECEAGWETYCESDCSATLGSTFTTIDPGSLLGG